MNELARLLNGSKTTRKGHSYKACPASGSFDQPNPGEKARGEGPCPECGKVIKFWVTKNPLYGPGTHYRIPRHKAR